MSNLNGNSLRHDRSKVFVMDDAARRRIAIHACVALAFILTVVLLFWQPGYLADWAKGISDKEHAAKIEPQMRELAQQGVPEARLWLAKTYPATDGWRLAALVQGGSGEAAYELAKIKHPTDQVEARRLLQVAAARGYAPAVETMLLLKP